MFTSPFVLLLALFLPVFAFFVRVFVGLQVFVCPPDSLNLLLTLILLVEPSPLPEISALTLGSGGSLRVAVFPPPVLVTVIFTSALPVSISTFPPVLPLAVFSPVLAVPFIVFVNVDVFV